MKVNYNEKTIEMTKSEAIKYYNFIDIHTLGPVI